MWPSPERPTLVAVLRLLTRKWLFTHALALGLVVVFLIFGRWQLARAESGHTASYAYAVEWPTFALMVVGFWVKIVRDELHPKIGDDGGALDSAQSGAARSAPRGGKASSRARDEAAAELDAYNRYLAERASWSASRTEHPRRYAG